jgi:hypothetical protein
MRRVRSSLLLAALLVAAAVGVAAGPASAGAASASAGANVFGGTLDELLAEYPDAKALGGGVYQLAPGVRLASPSASQGAAVAAESPSGCADQWVCFFQNANFGGWSLSYFNCTTVVLAPEHRNQISSIHNAQNSLSTFFWDTGPNPDVKGALGPNSYLRDLSKDTAPDGARWNDRIDQVKAC